MSACGGHQQEPNTTNDTASREGSVPGYRHFLTLLSGVVVGMPAAGPEAHLPDGEAVSGKPLSRAGPLAPGTRSLQGDPVCILLWSLLQRCQPKASSMSVRTAGRDASPRLAICQSGLLDAPRGTWNRGNGGGNQNVGGSAVSLPSGWPMLVYSASLSRPQSKWGERRQEGCGNDPVLYGSLPFPVWVQDGEDSRAGQRWRSEAAERHPEVGNGQDLLGAQGSSGAWSGI